MGTTRRLTDEEYLALSRAVAMTRELEIVSLFLKDSLRPVWDESPPASRCLANGRRGCSWNTAKARKEPEMKLTKEECEGIISQVRAVSTITAGVSQEEVEAMSSQVEREDSIAALIDPTGWMRTKEKSDNWRQLWTAFRTFREEVLRVQEAEMKRMEKAQQKND